MSVLQQAYELSASLRPFSDTLELLDSDVMLCRQMLDCRHCFEEWYPVICRMVLALALQCTARDPATRYAPLRFLRVGRAEMVCGGVAVPLACLTL